MNKSEVLLQIRFISLPFWHYWWTVFSDTYLQRILALRRYRIFVTQKLRKWDCSKDSNNEIIPHLRIIRNLVINLFIRGGGTVCSNGFYANIWSQRQVQNINHVWGHFYKILVVLKYHRRPWGNIFDTDIGWSINIPKNAKHTTLM